ncbi:MAG: hypothetical protein ACOH19_12495 [Rhodoglobus sp.]
MQDLMTKDAALVLGVSQRQVTELLRSGRLSGQQLQDGTWLVSRRSIGERKALHTGSGRAWSASSSWALLDELSGREAEGLSQSTYDRMKRRIRTTSADEIARKVATRTTAHRYAADSLARTAADLVLTGASAAEVINQTLTSETRRIEGYVREGQVDVFVRRHLLTRDAEGDVTIYEAPESQLLNGRQASKAVIAADLARSMSTRERSAALVALENMRREWLARHTR